MPGVINFVLIQFERTAAQNGPAIDFNEINLGGGSLVGEEWKDVEIPAEHREAAEIGMRIRAALAPACLIGCTGEAIIVADVEPSQADDKTRPDGTHLFAGLTSPFDAGRYHSLVIEPRSLPDTLVATATTSDGTVMAVRHRDYPIEGVQFHPEALLTEHGHRMLENFLREDEK